MSNIEVLLAALDGVKQTGTGRWLARCPAHQDRKASLSMRDMGDGRILIHCFAECETESVLGAIGLSFSDLYPERLPDVGYRRAPNTLTPREVLDIYGHEMTVAALILADVMDGKTVDEATWTRFAKASARISAAREHGR
jgi:hypothetical protein